jgi:hypothetical protein
MKYYIFLFILLFTDFVTAEINWAIFKGNQIDTVQRQKILNLADKLKIKNIYEIIIGPIDNFTSDEGIVVKGVETVKDTVQHEKWLYIWKINQRIKGFNVRNYHDFSVADTPYCTGPRNIRNKIRHIYHYGNQSRVFDLENCNYSEVKFILDCVSNGKAVEDSMKWKEEIRVKENWNKIKSNLINFVNVYKFGNRYRFGYCFSHPFCFEPEALNTEIIDAEFEAILSDGKCKILYGGPGAGSK